MASLAGSITKGVPMIYVPDVAEALDWYISIGFKELERFEDDGIVNFGMVAFGGAELMLNMHGNAGPHDVSLWFYTDQWTASTRLLKARHFDRAGGAGRRAGGRADRIHPGHRGHVLWRAAVLHPRPDGYELYFIQNTSR